MASNWLYDQKTAVNELKPRIQQIREDILAKFDELNGCVESIEKLHQEADGLIKNLDKSLANASEEAKEWQQIKARLALTAVKGKVILDIGGDKYTTSVESLTRERDSFFTALFSQQWELERDPKDDSIFIDRDGKLFTHVLAYLRTGSVSDEIMKNETLRQNVIAEAKYYQLQKLTDILTEPDRKKAEAKRKEAQRKKAEKVPEVKKEEVLTPVVN